MDSNGYSDPFVKMWVFCHVFSEWTVAKWQVLIKEADGVTLPSRPKIKWKLLVQMPILAFEISIKSQSIRLNQIKKGFPALGTICIRSSNWLFLCFVLLFFQKFEIRPVGWVMIWAYNPTQANVVIGTSKHQCCSNRVKANWHNPQGSCSESAVGMIIIFTAFI